VITVGIFPTIDGGLGVPSANVLNVWADDLGLVSSPSSHPSSSGADDGRFGSLFRVVMVVGRRMKRIMIYRSRWRGGSKL